MLQLTSREINDIISDNIDRFELIMEGLPKDDDVDKYIEDDGRQYRLCEFKDTETNETYYFQYVSYPDMYSDFPCDFLIVPEGITIVPISVIDPPKPVIPEPIVLTAEQKADKELWNKYLQTDHVPFVNPRTHKIPNTIITDICVFMKNSQFSMIQLRAKLIPVCIEYKVEQKSFWNWLQKNYKKRSK